MSKSYVLITPVRNEEMYIEKAIQSVINQTITPDKWVIVSDNSTDRTEEIVHPYLAKYDYIQLIRSSANMNREYGSRAKAILIGIEQLNDIKYEFLGVLDADITLKEDYYESVLRKFRLDPKLGIAGGILLELSGGKFVGRLSNPWNVAGGIQLFRKQCYKDIGGYIPNRRGGIDTIAEVTSRMYGWKVQSFSDIQGLHHRGTGIVGKGRLIGNIHLGFKDYSYGTHPLFEIFRCLHRAKEKPYFVGAIFIMAGFIWSYCIREKRIVSDEFVKYLRKEQTDRIWAILQRNR